MNTHEEILNATTEYMDGQIKLAMELLEGIRFHKDSPQELAICLLHTRSIHLSAGCSAAAKNRAAPCIPILTRSMWEADIALDNLIANPGFVNDLQLIFLEEKNRFTKSASQGNALLSAVKDLPDFLEITNQMNVAIDGLKKRGYKKKNIEEQAKDVNRLVEYRSVYAAISLDCHNNIWSLESDHINQKGDHSYEFLHYGNQMVKRATINLMMSVGLLTESICKTHRFFQTQNSRLDSILGKWISYRQELDAAYKKISPAF